MDSDVEHYNSSAGSFIGCLSRSYALLLADGYSSTADGNCSASQPVVGQKLSCLEQFAVHNASRLFGSGLDAQCASDSQLDYLALKRCALGAQGAQRQQLNTEACTEYLGKLYDKKNGQGGNGLTKGLQSLSSVVRRNGRQLLGSGHFDVNDLDFFGHKHDDKLEAKNQQIDYWMAYQPFFAVPAAVPAVEPWQVGKEGEHIESPCTLFNLTAYVGYICAALNKDKVDDDLKSKNIWAWVAGDRPGWPAC